ncbi:MAG: OadG family protein [Candidatus Cloacimonetes bacterium]|nr:OadG family protein [Candidatus Cloacimonadota bacterium]
MKRYLAIILLLIAGVWLAAQEIDLSEIEGFENIAALIDSLSQAREQSIFAEYGFRDTDILAYAAEKLEIEPENYNKWKAALGLEPANKTLDNMPLRRLEITPYRALLAKQTVHYGYNELSTLVEISESLVFPIKRLKRELDLDPLDKKYNNRSIQSLNVSVDRIQQIENEFQENSLKYGASLTLVGMLVVFFALLITSLIISQLVHLNRTKAPKATPTIKIAPDGKVKSAPKTLSQGVIVAAIAALHIHQEEIEAKRRMVLTFRRTPANQWRASSMLNMPNKDLSPRR